MNFDEAAICRHRGALIQHDNITDHNFLDIDNNDDVTTTQLGMACRHLLECSRRFLRTIFLVEPKRRVEENDENDDANKRVFIGHNGKSYWLRVGMEADVPECVLNVLDDATFVVAEKDPITQKLNGRTRNKKRFSYQMVR